MAPRNPQDATAYFQHRGRFGRAGVYVAQVLSNIWNRLEAGDVAGTRVATGVVATVVDQWGIQGSRDTG
eukprot:1833018-Lingulodinium_polyedra.AAC.1